MNTRTGNGKAVLDQVCVECFRAQSRMARPSVVVMDWRKGGEKDNVLLQDVQSSV